MNDIEARRLIESWDLQRGYDDIDWRDKLDEIVPQLVALTTPPVSEDVHKAAEALVPNWPNVYGGAALVDSIATALAAAEAKGFERAREAAAKIALAIDGGRGNEKEIAAAIRSLSVSPPASHDQD
jgi:hypothetical protein